MSRTPQVDGETEYGPWVGRKDIVTDELSPLTLQRLWATIDRPDTPPRNGEAAPSLAHWLYFLTAARQSELGVDGHARRGGFLPPIALPHRMWASSRIVYERRLLVGQRATRQSEIRSVTLKEGRSGPLAFVRLQHTISDDQGLAVSEEQDIVYRGGKIGSAEGQPAPPTAAFQREVTPDIVTLFRYSALTFNGHRIHYDREYAVGHEGYPGLLVHGPLIATLLADLLQSHFPGFDVKELSFRAVHPIFDDKPFRICAQPRTGSSFVDLWATRHDGILAMQATAQARAT